MRNPLAKYLRETGESQTAFGKRIGATGAMVCRYANETRIPTVTYALAMERETGGKVPASYWARIEVKRSRQHSRRRGFDPSHA